MSLKRSMGLAVKIIYGFLLLSTAILFAEVNRQALKAPLQPVPGMKDPVLLVKFNSRYGPDLTSRGVFSFRKGFNSSTLSSLTSLYQLSFTRVLPLSRVDLERYRSGWQPPASGSGFDILKFAGLMYVHVPNPTQDLLVEIGNQLQGLTQVEYCWIRSAEPVSPPSYNTFDNAFTRSGDIPPETPDMVEHQIYRGPDPGVDIDYAWSLGLRGSGIQISNLEWSVGDLDHEDIMDADIVDVFGKVTDEFAFHGEGVMGLMLSPDNGYGINGSVPEASGLFFSELYQTREYAYTHALDSSGPGDFILLEMQTGGPLGENVPADYDRVLWDLTKEATDAGIFVIGTTGNGGQDLDGVAYNEYRGRGDNGVIMVTGGTPDTLHALIEERSTYGSLVHLQAWGEEVFTLGEFRETLMFGDDTRQAYTLEFRGASSAGPIATSAAALIHAYTTEFMDSLLTPRQMRELLVSTGVPGEDPMPPLPDIRAALEALNPSLAREPQHFETDPAYKASLRVMGNNLYIKNVQDRVRVFSVQGQLLSVTPAKMQTVLDISALPRGMYFVRVDKTSLKFVK